MKNPISCNLLSGISLTTAALFVLAGCSNTADRSTERSMDRTGDRSPDRAGTTWTTAPMDKEAPGKRTEHSTAISTTDQRTDAMRADESTVEHKGGQNQTRQVDNSGQNEVDRDSASVTPFDQGTSESDMSITQAIRKSLTSDSSMSINAQNLKIITRSGVVVLRGPVANQVEADAVLEHVRTINGVTRIDNQIAIP